MFKTTYYSILWVTQSNINAKGARGGEVVRHYATNQQDAGSIPNSVTGIFQ